MPEDPLLQLRNQIRRLQERLDRMEQQEAALPGPRFHVDKNGTDQTPVQTGQTTLVTWSRALYDPTGAFNLLTNRFQPAVPGLYWLSASPSFVSLADQTRYFVSFYKNNVEFVRNEYSAGGLDRHSAPLIALVDMNGSSDDVDVRIWQNSGSNRTLEGLAVLTYWMGCYAGPRP